MSKSILEAMETMLANSGLSPEDKIILSTRLAAIQLVDINAENISFNLGNYTVELKISMKEDFEQLQKSNDFIFGLSTNGEGF